MQRKQTEKGIPDKRCGGVIVLIDARDINEMFEEHEKKKKKKILSITVKTLAMIMTVLQRMERREVRLFKAWSQLSSKMCFSTVTYMHTHKEATQHVRLFELLLRL